MEIKLLVIADDLTGALDTGVKLAKEKISTLIVLNFKEIEKQDLKDYEVIVIDTNSRHMEAKKAGQKIEDILRHFKDLEVDIEYIYKKTDSALRGNIGSELSALLRASDSKELHFIPALPEFNRVTIDGIHYIDGKKLEDSVFAKDPFEPVEYSSVKDIIKSQSNIETITTNTYINESKNERIIIYDAKVEQDILDIAKSLFKKGRLKTLAGCAGFINVLPELIEFNKTSRVKNQVLGNFLAVCGSINPVTQRQVEYALDNGFKGILLKVKDLETRKDYWSTSTGKAIIEEITKSLHSQEKVIVYLDTLFGNKKNLNMDGRFKIAEALGQLVQIIVTNNIAKNVLITGGDTLRGLCNVANIKRLIPHHELMEGIVKAKVEINNTKFNLISKSGGFGDEKTISEIAGILCAKESCI
ncbi:MAG TPA: four-carbon acid sugar kinase family protein [Tissierellaceae bacterium]|nr:four-carbon acid sugar kinase family protein [Tissierellaceae bacterium]